MSTSGFLHLGSVLFSVPFLIIPAIWGFLAVAAHCEGDFRELSVTIMNFLPLDAIASSDEASWKLYWMLTILHFKWHSYSGLRTQLCLGSMNMHLPKKSYANLLSGLHISRVISVEACKEQCCKANIFRTILSICSLLCLFLRQVGYRQLLLFALSYSWATWDRDRSSARQRA